MIGIIMVPQIITSIIVKDQAPNQEINQVCLKKVKDFGIGKIKVKVKLFELKWS